MELREHLVAEFPPDPHYQQELAGTCLNLSSLRASQGQPRAAEKICLEAEAIQERLVKVYPQASFRQELARIRGAQWTGTCSGSRPLARSLSIG